MHFYQIWPKRKQDGHDPINRNHHWSFNFSNWVHGVEGMKVGLLLAIMLLPALCLWGGYWLGTSSPCSEVERFDIWPRQ